MFDDEQQGNIADHAMLVTLDETPPASHDEARAEDRVLLNRILAIDAQLAERRPRDFAWKPKAIKEKRALEQRRRFLRQWLWDNRLSRIQPERKPDAALGSMNTVYVLRQLTKRIGQLEAVFASSVHYLDHDTDEAFLEWERVVSTARAKLMGDPAGAAPDE